MRRPRPLAGLAALLAALLLAGLVVRRDADGAFPGVNGRIAFTVAKTVCAADEDPCTTVIEIWTIRPDGSQRTLLGGYGIHPAFAPGGRWITVDDGTGTIVADSVTGAGRWGIYGATDAAWSPGGGWLVFAAEGEGVSWVLYRSRPDGTHMRAITSAPPDRPCPEGCRLHIAYAPAWSTANEIAFVRVDPWHLDVRYIAVMRPDGRGERAVTRGPADGDPDWSPDGRRLAFMRRTPQARGDIWTATRRGTQLRRLTRGRADDSVPVWSPDGRLIAFSRNEALWLMDADGRHAHPLRGARAGSPLWLDWEALR